MAQTTINPNNRNNNKKDIATHGGAAAAGAGLGVAGAMAANMGSESHSTAPHPTPAPNPNPAPAPEPQPEPVPEPQPEPSPEPQPEPEPEPAPAPEPSPEPTPDIIEEDPEEIAEAIIREDEVDPNDIDMADIITFDEIGTVYTLDGESYTAASFHDMEGNQLAMIDVDGDNVFDIITDMDGNPIITEDGSFLAAGNLTVDDAQMNIDASAGYMAANDDSVDDMFDDDSLLDDILDA